MMEAVLNQSTVSLSHRKRNTAVRSTLMLLFVGDVLVVLGAAVAAVFVRFSLLKWMPIDHSLATLADYRLHIILASVTLPALLYYRHAYSLHNLARYRYGAFRMLQCAFYWSVIFISFTLFFEIQPPISRIWVALTGAFAGGGLALSRYCFCRHFIGRGMLQSIRHKALVVGWNEKAQELYHRSDRSNRDGSFFPFRIRSCVVLKEQSKSLEHGYPNHISRGNDFEAIEKQLGNGRHDTVILADSNLDGDSILKLQEICGRHMVDFMIIPDFVHTLNACLRVESFAGLPMLTQHQQQANSGLNLLIKRVFDITGALVGLSLTAPVIAYFCWRVYRESPGPVFYRQVRTGERGKPFEIIKIRSMPLDAEKETGAKWCTAEDTRRLAIGAFMRKHNIDELPQFWNVLKGEMSLVGPRPERPELINDFKHEISFYNVRHMVKPGITGWAQVNGWRGDTCLHSRIASDLEYIERWSIWMDLYICFKTLYATKNAY